jgi:hypothetical protein
MKRAPISTPVNDVVRIDAREFVRVWQSSNTVSEVASRTRNTRNAVKVRAYRYRQMGVPLKEFPPVETEKINWSELADLARCLASSEAGAQG